MRKSAPYVFAALVALALAVPASAADSPQKPGQWQVRMERDMPGMPVKLPPVNWDVCVTEEDLKDPSKAVPGNDPKKKTDCKVSDYKVDGKTVTWAVECPRQNTKGVGEVTYDGNSFAGWVDMTAGEQEVKMKITYTGKRLGECTK